ncbi:MAG: hypothetical protein R3C20_17830 [Planctomycetaceae bacterium]
MEMTRIEHDSPGLTTARPKALQWIADHPVDAVRLGPMKIVNEYRPHSVTEFIVLVLAIIGILLTWRSLETRIFAFLPANAVMIALTWSWKADLLSAALQSSRSGGCLAIIPEPSVFYWGSPPAPVAHLKYAVNTPCWATLFT